MVVVVVFLVLVLVAFDGLVAVGVGVGVPMEFRPRPRTEAQPLRRHPPDPGVSGGGRDGGLRLRGRRRGLTLYQRRSFLFFKSCLYFSEYVLPYQGVQGLFLLYR